MLDALFQFLPRAGGRAEFAALDVSVEADALALAARLPALDLLVNNAGVAAKMDGVADVPLADWRRLFAVNVQGVFIVAQEGARRFAQRK